MTSTEVGSVPNLGCIMVFSKTLHKIHVFSMCQKYGIEIARVILVSFAVPDGSESNPQP